MLQVGALHEAARLVLALTLHADSGGPQLVDPVATLGPDLFSVLTMVCSLVLAFLRYPPYAAVLVRYNEDTT